MKDLSNDENLISAIDSKNQDDIKRFLLAGADPNIKDSYKTPILIRAVANRWKDIIELLLGKGANINSQVLITKKTPLMFAIQLGFEDIALSFLDKKVKLDLQTNNGSTALLYSIEEEQFNLSERLLKLGANPNLLGGIADKRTVLMASIAVRNLKLTKKLMNEYKADVNVVNDKGWTAITYAISVKNDNKYLEEILKKKPIVNIPDNMGNTDIMHAVSLNEIKKVNLLIAHKSNINTQNNKGRTALMKAVILLKEPEVIVRKLLENGADPCIKDNNGNNALDIFMKLDRNNKILMTLLTEGFVKIRAEEKKQREQHKSKRHSQLRTYIKQRHNTIKL